MMSPITIGFSTCPNDTFIFHAMTHGLVDTRGLTFTPLLRDVEELNRMAIAGSLHISKLSFYAYFRLKNDYMLLDSGAALGFGCGPLVVARPDRPFTKTARIAVPGEHTTAFLLLRLWAPEIGNIEITRFDEILEGVKTGRYDAGLIIHEGRFIYPQYDLCKIIDLGEWWESETGLPIPLGCICLRKDMEDLKPVIETIIRDSVKYGFKNRGASRDFVRHHAREMDDAVIDSHIDLYVNDFSVSLGETGREAVHKLEETAIWKKVL